MKPAIRRFASPAIALAKGAIASRALLGSTGHVRTMWSGRAEDRDGAPVPWMTYCAIEFFETLDLAGITVFEFGSGASTHYWIGRKARVVSVEDDPRWFDEVGDALIDDAARQRVERLLEPDPARYAERFPAHAGDADLVVIDGIRREDCARVVNEHARPDAVVVLDNADWHETSDQMLRSTGRVRIPFTGFGPVNPYVWTTAVYLPRGDCRLLDSAGRRPLRLPPGGVAMDSQRRELEQRSRASGPTPIRHRPRRGGAQRSAMRGLRRR